MKQLQSLVDIISLDFDILTSVGNASSGASGPALFVPVCCKDSTLKDESDSTSESSQSSSIVAMD